MKSMKRKSALILAIIILGTAGLITLAALGIGQNRVMSVGNVRQGLDLMGGVSILYAADIPDPTPADMNAAIALLRGRLDRRGYMDADVASEGAGQIRVDIPGVEDAEAARDEIGATAMLFFIDETGFTIDGEGPLILQDRHGGYLRASINPSGRFMNDAGEPLLTGAYVDSAFAAMGERAGDMIVVLNFDRAGGAIFAQMTAANLGRPIYIFMDNEEISSPIVQTTIDDGTATITGMGTRENAQRLAADIQQGSLPFGLTVESMSRVGARLGADALRTSIVAGIIGLALVLIFMSVFYRTMGLCADLALIIYVVLVLLVISGLGITLTLPGIAGLILSIGMATDANIVIFERIREEVAGGKALRSAMRAGYRRAWPAIVDSNVTTLIAGGVLFWLGTGPIMGFAQMLIIGILMSMFTCLIVTRVITSCLMDLGLIKPDHVISRKQKEALEAARAANALEPEMEYAPQPIVEKRKIYFGISAAIIAVGLFFALFNNFRDNGFFNLGVEFSGGTAIEADIGQEFENSDIEEIVRGITGESAPMVQQVRGIGADDEMRVLIRTTSVDDNERVDMIAELSYVYDLNPDDFTYEVVGPAVGAAMRRSAVMAIALAGLGMLAYISVRFRDFRKGASAVLAQFHDVLIVLCVYTILRIPLNYAFIAVLLTTLGYSINATIIIFDRIRENRVRLPKASNSELINTSVTQTLRRTLFSTLSSFIAVFMLYVIGVAAIRDFTLPIMVGLLFGAYSSVCLSGSAWFMMLKKRRSEA